MIINKFLSLLKRYKTDSPTFTIVGVGPGDPSLLTIAAVDAIKKAKVIVFPISDDNKKSFAAEIVRNIPNLKKISLSSSQWLGRILIQMKYGLML